MRNEIESAQDQVLAKRAKDLIYWTAQAAMTNEQIISAYCEEFRAGAAAQIKGINEASDRDKEIDDYIRVHGTEEG